MNDDQEQPEQRDVEGEIHDEQIRHPETLYDRSDLSARGIVYFIVTLALVVVMLHILVWGFFRWTARQQLTRVPRVTAIVTPESQTGKRGDPALRFPAPQLQPNPVADLNKFRTAIEEALNSSGPGHIPIQQAIDNLVKQGLPVRPQPVLPPRARFGTGDAGAAGAGGGTEPAGNK